MAARWKSGLTASDDRPSHLAALQWLRRDPLAAVLLLALPVLLWLRPLPPLALADLVHWQTIAALTGLMLLSRALEVSGFLAVAGTRLLRRAGQERRLALALVLFSAGLAAVVTNDVALFIVVPLTLTLRTATELPVARLIIFEALAVNAGSTLSPIGNPQNLYLWQAADAGFVEFTLAMLPLGGGMLLLLLALLPIAFRARPIVVTRGPVTPRLDRVLLLPTLLLYPLFLLAAEAGWVLPATLLVAGILLVLRRGVLLSIDWGLLLVFVLMFVNLGLLAQWPPMRALATTLMELPGGIVTGAMLTSQVISNVPAAIFLAEFTPDWRLLAWGVNVGGFGLAIGSLANLIALRLARRPGLWIEFHVWSLPILAASWLLALMLLAILG